MISQTLRAAFSAAALAAALSSASQVAAQGQATAPSASTATGRAAASNPVPSADVQIMLVRDSLTAFNHANLTNDYGVMQALASANFRAANDPEKLSKTFAIYRTNKVNISPILFLNPVLSRRPTIEGGRLRISGYFPSNPMVVNFDLTFEPSEGQWKLFGISVTLAPSQQGQPKK